MLRAFTAALLVAAIGSSVSCQTYYDAQGNPVQAVDPAAATALAVGAGLAGAAIANNQHSRGPSGPGPGGPGPRRPGPP